MADHKTDGLSISQRNYLSRRAFTDGDNFRKSDHVTAHHRALGAGHKEGSGPYFKAVSDHADAIAGSRKRSADLSFEGLRKNASSNHFPKK